jgi:hypothetical protein
VYAHPRALTMKKATHIQVDAARRLLAREAPADESTEEQAAAAGRAYEKVVAHLGTLLGPVAARALFARSVKLSAPEYPCLGRIDLSDERPDRMREQLVRCLEGEPPEVVAETAVALFATLLALLGRLIGDPLTAQLLRDSWRAFRAARDVKEEK